MVLAVGIAVTLLALVVIGIRAVDEPKLKDRRHGSIPGRGSSLPPSLPWNRPPAAGPGRAPSAAPVIPPNGPWDVDMTPPTVRVADPSGRFEMLVPDIWESTSSFAPDLREWKLPVRTFPPASELLLIGFTFSVYSDEPSMCDLRPVFRAPRRSLADLGCHHRLHAADRCGRRGARAAH